MAVDRHSLLVDEQASSAAIDDVHVDQVILKIAQRCNLDCTYCYVYNRGDDSWRTRPAYISDRITLQLARRIREHCERYERDNFTVELHGGEPLLLGRRRMARLVEVLRAEAAPVRLRIVMQTNGTLLDAEWIELLAHHNISFGISLDGPPEIGDRRRVTRRRHEGSTQTVLDNVRTLRALGPDFDDLFGGFLCVIDSRSNGAEIVRWFVEQGFDTFDLLLPDGNRANPPQEWAGVEPYTRYLLDAFEQWYSMDDRAPRIRMFEQMIMGLMGNETPLDALGGDLRRLCVVESDGSIGVNDVARICGGDFSRDVLNIFDHQLAHHVPSYRIAEIQRVCHDCLRCPHLASCGGGYLPHRFDGLSFANPSLYCDALYALSDRMVAVLKDNLPSHLWVESVDATTL